MTPDWRPTALPQAIQARAELYRDIREFFQQRNVLEVETPLLSSAGNTDPHIDSIRADNPLGYLQTSPEFAMKRLLAAGSGSIYQICKAFRAAESGARHNPEFALLEWYRPGLDYHQLMDEVADLVNQMLGACGVEKLSYREVFDNYLAFDPLECKTESLLAVAQDKTGFSGDADRDTLLDLLMSHLIEPQLGRGCLTFIYDYPASQSALARVGEDAHGDRVAQRFELYFEGMELANGYQELTDDQEQLRRFQSDNIKRRELGKPEVAIDQHLIAALQQGMPDCSGVALGLDRLLMLKLGCNDIREVISFDADRA